MVTIARTAAKATAFLLLAIVATLGLLLATGTAHVYDAPGNAGVVVGSVGFELRGVDGAGFFTCHGQC